MDGQGAKVAIAATREAFIAALNGRDARAAGAVYADDARLLPPSADLIEGREAIEALWQAGVQPVRAPAPAGGRLKEGRSNG